MTERVIGPTGGRRRRWTLGFVVAAALSAGLILAVGASANLAGSSFEGNDGNLVVNTAGNTDWDNAPNLSVGIDLPTGATDNSFGQGAKENNVQTTVVDGSIPNSKADLARFAVAGETIGNEHLPLPRLEPREPERYGQLRLRDQRSGAARPDDAGAEDARPHRQRPAHQLRVPGQLKHRRAVAAEVDGHGVGTGDADQQHLLGGCGEHGTGSRHPRCSSSLRCPASRWAVRRGGDQPRLCWRHPAADMRSVQLRVRQVRARRRRSTRSSRTSSPRCI